MALLLTTQRYKLHKMMSGSYQSRSAPTRSPLPLLIHTATKRFTSIPYLIAESFIPQAFNAYRDAKLHEWVSDPQLGRSKQFNVRKVAVASGYALVSWLEGEAGGQALLQRQSGTWKILTHGGGWLGLRGLKQAGVPQPIAERLLTQIDPKWRNYEQ